VTGHVTGTPALVPHDETSRGPGIGPPTRHVRITVSAARTGPDKIPSSSSNPTVMATPRAFVIPTSVSVRGTSQEADGYLDSDICPLPFAGYCPRYRHRPLYHMPPAYAHRSSSEGSEPDCASLAQPARLESTHSRASTVAANLMVRCPRYSARLKPADRQSPVALAATLRRAGHSLSRSVSSSSGGFTRVVEAKGSLRPIAAKIICR